MKKFFLYVGTFCLPFIASYICTSEVLLQPPEADSVEQHTFPADEDISDLPMSTNLCPYRCIEGTFFPDPRDWPVTRIEDEKAALTIKVLLAKVRDDYALWYSRCVLEAFVDLSYEDRQAMLKDNPNGRAYLYVAVRRVLNQYQEEKKNA
jgi:hypothetical protein